MASSLKLPELLPVQWATLAVLPEAAAVTKDNWERGGVEILYANPAFCGLTGYSAEEIVGRNTRVLHGTKTDLTPLLNNRPAHQSIGEGWLCRKDGTPFFARWHFSPLPGMDTPSGELVAVYHDQSEIKRLRDALLESRKLDTVGRLASGVAHDFNILLSIINGYCEIMTRKIADVPAVKKDLDEIHRAGLKASAIARQILEFSQRHETEVKVVNYNTLIREITEILRRVAGDEVTLELRLTSGLGNARIDPTQFQQVLLNLCFNAREAMPKGGKLTIRTYNHKVVSESDRRVAGMRNGFYSAVQVTDTGHGMEPGTLSHIFEPFFTTKPSGTGLGLATVLGIIRQHDGHITVQSTPSAGTTFEVFLPETPEQEQTTPTKPSNVSVPRGSEKLLLIEQDGVLRKMIAGILATEGYLVTDVATARAANSILLKKKLKPQLILAPCHDKASATLVRKLHAKNPRLRLIDLSCEPAASQVSDFPTTAAAHLPKPFALSKLTACVRKLLDSGSR
jgi:two-component system, cell cycle sensor histidine kinase and response regulator CckA